MHSTNDDIWQSNLGIKEEDAKQNANHAKSNEKSYDRSHHERDRKTNEWIREQTGLRDIKLVTSKLKWQWAGHIARLPDNRWTKTVTEWIPLEGKRKQAWPKLRWEDEIRKCAGVT